VTSVSCRQHFFDEPFSLRDFEGYICLPNVFACDLGGWPHPPARTVKVRFSCCPRLCLCCRSLAIVGAVPQVTVELKNDLAIIGTLHSVDQYLNIKLHNTRVVNETKYPHMVRHSTIDRREEREPSSQLAGWLAD
jgi:small nuclear ribonucleoprotein (snRNP)-like protein